MWHWLQISQGVRVARLGDISHIGWLFTSGSFWIAEIAHVLGYFFPHWKLSVNFGQKNALGYILGEFFSNSSGHPAS
jgi:hypothetical protein